MIQKVKVLSFVASCRGEQSVTAKFSNLVAKRLALRTADMGSGIEYECIRADQLKINFCRGCERCFAEGICPTDRTDDVERLKRKMLEADILFFCSPVYTAAMSGQAKTVLDRLAYWTHRMELAGKTTAVLVTTSGSYGEATAEQIALALRAMGAAVAYAGCVSRHVGRINLHLPDQMDPELDAICEKLLDCHRDPSAYLTENQDQCFAYFSRHFSQSRAYANLIGATPKREVVVWEERGFLHYESLRDYVRRHGSRHSEDEA